MRCYRLLLFVLFASCWGRISAQAPTTFGRESASTAVAVFNPHLAPFYHGVASGDPLSDAVILWTRVTHPSGGSGPISVHWEMATDLAFSSIVTQGDTTTTDARDYTVKIDATGLQPGAFYYFRFVALGDTSLIGRTKTAPVGAVSRMRIGVLSCQDYRRGYYNALRNLANRNDIDVVLHTGDYLYEGGGGPANRTHEPNYEMWQIQDYRQRYSQYHLDPDLMRCHQVYPWVTIFDDHDIVVDALRDTSYRHDAAQHGTYTARKQAAIQAMREWLPVRDPEADSLFFKNWRNLQFGNLVEVFNIDCRIYDRDRFADDTNDPIYNTPTHRMLGPEQLTWLNTGLINSPAQWKVVQNGLMFTQFQVAGSPFVLENWDGYPAERNRIFDTLENHNVDNLVFASGDFHCAFANDITRNPNSFTGYSPSNGNGSLGVEFICPSISSDNFDEGNDFGLGTSNAGVAEAGIRLANRHTKYVNLTAHGYLLLDITPQRCTGEFWYTQNILTPGALAENLAASWYTNAGENYLKQGSGATATNPDTVLAPPDAPVFVATAEAAAPVVLSLFPNPLVGENCYLNVALNSRQALTVQVLDATGRTLRTVFAGECAPGNLVFTLNLAGLPSGTYRVSVQSPAGVQSLGVLIP